MTYLHMKNEQRKAGTRNANVIATCIAAACVGTLLTRQIYFPCKPTLLGVCPANHVKFSSNQVLGQNKQFYLSCTRPHLALKRLLLIAKDDKYSVLLGYIGSVTIVGV